LAALSPPQPQPQSLAVLLFGSDTVGFAEVAQPQLQTAVSSV